MTTAIDTILDNATYPRRLSNGVVYHAPLTERQRAMYAYTVKMWQRKGRTPTIREYQEACGIPSTSTVTYNLMKLENAGLIEVDQIVARGVRLTTPTPFDNLADAVVEATSDLEAWADRARREGDTQQATDLMAVAAGLRAALDTATAPQKAAA